MARKNILYNYTETAKLYDEIQNHKEKPLERTTWRYPCLCRGGNRRWLLWDCDESEDCDKADTEPARGEPTIAVASFGSGEKEAEVRDEDGAATCEVV